MSNRGQITRFYNCYILRESKIIKEDLWMRDGKIENPEQIFYVEQLKPNRDIDCKNMLIAPGFIDIQINGGWGIDFSYDCDAVEKGIAKVAKELLAHGVTSFCPTMVTSCKEKYAKILPKIKKSQGGKHGATVLGAHLEGPFISLAKKGAHLDEYIRTPDKGLESIHEVYGSLENVTIVTLAPELPGAKDAIKGLAALGIKVALGHSTASLAQAEEAVENGANLITHLFNAMLPFHHRDPGLVGLLASTTKRQVHYGIISDGIHTHPAALRIACRTNPKGLILVSDAVAAQGLQDGQYRIGPQAVTVQGGRAYVSGTNTLCGSTTALDECILTFKQSIDCSLEYALEVASLHPAQALGIDNRKEDALISTNQMHDEVPEEYLSHKEKYENAVKKSCVLFDILKNRMLQHSSFDSYRQASTTNIYRGMSMVKQYTPLTLHIGMFVPTIFGQASSEQLSEWLPKALSWQIIGTYAQTELGHGTFLRGLETTATYDPSTEEFELHSPTLTSFKWWPGGLGHTANYCIVVAQLYTKGVCHGIHPFMVQIRDEQTHIPLPGIKVGEIGPKMGLQTANNGFLGFDHFRIPRENMLMKNAQVLKDGTFVKSINEKLTYGTMMLIRVMTVTDEAYELSRAGTIAVRYSAVRHQSQPKPDQPETQILNYVTQQHKLFIAIATSHALRLSGRWLWATYSKVTNDLEAGNLKQLPELHALACCLKAVSSRDASALVEQCRLACGGHGYMASSNFPTIYGASSAAVTYEGESTVLLLQTARYLMKAWKEALDGKVMTPTLSFMVTFKRGRAAWKNDPEGIIRGFQAVAAGKAREAYEAIKRYQETGKDYEDAWNAASVQLVNASEFGGSCGPREDRWWEEDCAGRPVDV